MAEAEAEHKLAGCSRLWARPCWALQEWQARPAGLRWAGLGTDSDQSRPSRAVDVQTVNGMQESGVQQHFSMHHQ